MSKLMMFSSISYAGQTAINRIVPVTVQEVHRVTATDVERGWFYLIYFSYTENCVLIHKLGSDVLLNKAAIDISGQTPDFSVGPYYLNRVNINNNNDFGLTETILEDDILVILYERQSPDIMTLIDFSNPYERIMVNPVSGKIELFAAELPAISMVGPRLSIQIEGEGPNALVLYNQALDDPAWTKTTVADVLEATDDPIGGQTAWTLIPSVDNARHSVSQAVTVRTLALFAQRVGYDYAFLRYQAGANVGSIICNLLDGTLTEEIESGVSAVLYSRSQPIAWNGYYFEVTLDADSTIAEYGVTNSSLTATFAGDATEYNNLWLPQGNDATIYCSSPIRTEGTSETRGNDNAILSEKNFVAYGGQAYRFVVWPWGGNAQISDEREIAEFQDFKQNIRVFYDGSDKKMKVHGRRFGFNIGYHHDAWGLTHWDNYAYYTTYARRLLYRVNMLTREESIILGTDQIPSPCRLQGIDTDGTYLYISILYGPLEGIWRYDMDATNPVLLCTEHVDNNYKLRIDDTKIYWTSGPGGGRSVFSCPKAGGSATDENCLDALFGLAVDDANLYWATGSVIRYRAKTGGPITDLVVGVVGQIGGLAVDGPNIYWTTQTGGGLWYCPIATGSPIVQLTPYDGPTANPYLMDCFVEGNTLWYAQPLDSDNISRGLYTVWKGAIESPATTHDALNPLVISIDPADGTLDIDGFLTNNGTYHGLPWDVTVGDVSIGMDKDALHQFDGIVHLSKLR